MDRKKMKRVALGALIGAFSLSSCADKDVYQGEHKNTPLNPTEVFDFSMVKQVKVNVDYGFTNDYYVIFGLYDQNPLKEVGDSWVKDETLAPVYSASTDKKGKYSGTIQIPTAITEVWLYTDYLGTVSPVKLTVSAGGEINFNQAEYVASLSTKTRGTTSGGYTYLDSWKLMPGVDWDGRGYPNNMEDNLSMPSADILYSIKDVYSKVNGYKITDLHPEWLNNNTTSEIKITKATELSLVFVTSGAQFNNTVGFFTYTTGTIPTEASIQKVLAFPNASPITKMSDNGNGSLLCGHEVKLKYWNEAEQKFEDKFPAGVTVGWCLQAMGFNKGNIVNGMGIRYSYSSMNSDNAQRVVALREKSSDQIVAIGFEDNKDYDYCDAVFYLKVAESGAIDTDGPELPPVGPPSGLDNTVTYKGTLAYEDLWPSRGDYDMNDMVVKYQSTLYRNVLTNKVYKIVDEFTPVHNGASYVCGFGYQLHKVLPDRVRSVDVSGPEGWRVETGQSYPTIILFDNLRTVLNQTFTVTLELADVDQAQVQPPYNPFIFARSREVEVHLVNYPPTDKANMELFNTADDQSNISSGIYYISRYQDDIELLMPYGINLPTHDFNIPAETVKIYDTYPGFKDWVRSHGASNSDWYKKN